MKYSATSSRAPLLSSRTPVRDLSLYFSLLTSHSVLSTQHSSVVKKAFKANCPLPTASCQLISLGPKKSRTRFFRHTPLSLLLILLSLTIFSPSVEKEERGKNAFFASEKKSDDVLLVADWVVRSMDNHGMPFVIVDKKSAKLFVFDIEGRILAVTSVLLGLAIGDMTTPGIGNLKLSEILPKDRTTAAGRFLLRHGLNLDGGKVLWIDFESGLAIHTIPAGKSEASRLKRLQSNNLKDRRVTLGCVNVTREFYRTILSPLFDNANGYIYILPETMQTASFFGISR